MCGLEFPDLEANVWQKYKDRGLQVLAVNAGGLTGPETDATIQAFVNQTGITFPAARDLSRSYRDFSAPGGISPCPLDVIIDQQGVIRYVKPEYDATAMETVLDELVP